MNQYNKNFIDIFQDKKILYKTENEKTEILEKISKIKPHNILNLNFLNHYFIYIFQTDDKKIILRLYKKSYDFSKKEWNKNDLFLITSLSLNFDEPLDDIYNIDNIDNPEFIENNNSQIEDVDFVFYFPYDLKERDQSFFNIQQYNSIIIDENFEDNTIISEWGHAVNYKDIRWMINIETMINSNYGVGDNFCFKFRSSSFSKKNFIDIYYQNINRDTLIFKKIIDTVSFICDKCNKNFDDLEKTKMWHNSLYGDLCDICINEKIKKEQFRKNIIKEKILLIGKKKIFEKKLISTKLFLAKNKIKEFSIEKKYSICKKILNNTKNIIINNYNSCSICLENMEYDIYTGTCGHCFHKKCVFSLKYDECPLCRIETIFFKLYLD
jgi:hypothetical protein